MESIPEVSPVMLEDDTARHVGQVLRMKEGELLQLTNGRGLLATAAIVEAHKKKCIVKIVEQVTVEPPRRSVTVALSLLKNANRFEWFLEKATELGITTIIPLLCARTERQHFREERLKNILVSAMLQSQQVWLPQLMSPQPIKEVLTNGTYAQKFIAHCIEAEKKSLAATVDQGQASAMILIGPEGDFTPDEISGALEQGFVPVTLGETRLRAETAAVTAAVLLQLAG